jgi:tetratricopeptide (TPR) repeat protein
MPGQGIAPSGDVAERQIYDRCHQHESEPGAARPPVIYLTLNRLTSGETQVLAARVARQKGLPPEVLEQIVTKTDGVPLFVEELTKMLLESGLLDERDDRYELRSPLQPLTIPSTLQDSLTARLDRLGDAKEVAQLGATIGRIFPYAVLTAISSRDADSLLRAVDRLVEAELVYRDGVPPQATYTFKHALVQEAAYQTLLKSTRQRYHQRIASVLVEQFPETADTQPELVAHHFTEAGLLERGTAYWHQAALRAFQRSAPLETVAHCTKGLETVSGVADSGQALGHELGLQIILGLAWQHTKGWASAEMQKAFDRADSICRTIGDTPQVVPAIAGLAGAFSVRGELQTAKELAERLLLIGEKTADSGTLVEARYILGFISYYRGELKAAQIHLGQSAKLYDPVTHDPLTFVYGNNVGVTALSFVPIVLWNLGYPEQALKSSKDMLILARRVAHPFSSVWALAFSAWHRALVGDWPAVQQQAEAAIVLAEQERFPFWIAVASGFLGVALVQQGRIDEGIALQLRGTSMYRAMGAELGLTHLLAFLVESYSRGQMMEEALRVIGEALELVQKNGEYAWEPELYRLKGEVLRMQPAAKDYAPEECFRRAIDLARGRDARGLELRAAMSLSRLLREHHKRQEARRLLSDVYLRFTEGYETSDLRQARGLLEELS